MGEKREGSGGEGGGKWGERGRELGMGYPPVHPLCYASGDFVCPGTATEARLDGSEELNALANPSTFF